MIKTLEGACWQVRPVEAADGHHFPTKEAAERIAKGWDIPNPVIERMPEPCVVVSCDCCGTIFGEEADVAYHNETADEARAALTDTEWALAGDGTALCPECAVGSCTCRNRVRPRALPGYMAEAIDEIVDALHRADLTLARRRFDAAAVNLSQESLTPFLKALSKTVPIPAGTVVWGHMIDMFANPHRYGYGWRCGSCHVVGVNYSTPRGAERGANRHSGEKHASTLEVVKWGSDAYAEKVAAG